MNFYSSALLAVSMFTHQAQAVKCNALALSGGGSWGSWEVGVIYGLSHFGNPEDYYYDTVSGISVGSINAAGMAGWAPEEVVEMSEYLSDAWSDLVNEDIWLYQPDEKTALWSEQSLLDNSPLLPTIQEIMGVRSEFKKRVSVSAVDVNTGEFVEFNQHDTSYFDFGQASLASGSIPGIFPPQYFKDHVLMDGGTVWNVNVDSALRQCKEMGATNEEITLDIAICGYSVNPEMVLGNSVNNYMQARNLHKFYDGRVNDNPDRELAAYPGVNVRYYFQMHPEECNLNILDFNGDETWCMQEQGQNDAKIALAIGQDNIKQAMSEYYNSIEIQEEYPYVYNYILDQYKHLI